MRELLIYIVNLWAVHESLAGWLRETEAPTHDSFV